LEKIIVHGGETRLEGAVKIEGAKNAVLPMLAATLLASEGQTTLENVPILSDVYMMNEVLQHLGVELEFDEETNETRADATGELDYVAPYEYVSKMRASIVVMGPLLARLGRARVSMPGGCSIGSRPIDLHLKGFEALGAKINQTSGYIEVVAPKLVGNRIYLDFPSVGATQNIMMAATLAEGTTIIENVAREPEIVDLANLLGKMGAKIHGAGTETIRVNGVKALHGAKHWVLQDRIEAGTFMVAAAMTRGNVLIENAEIEHNRPLISKLIEMGALISETDEGIRVLGPEILQPTNVKTMPHPGFPTDLQAPMTAIQAIANGQSKMTETVFENRFQQLLEMRRMNLDVVIDGSVAVIHGGKLFEGTDVLATDLRSAAALVLLGLVSFGETRVGNLQYLDRGYYKFHEKLAQLGANIERINVDEKAKTK
jgi:UDP-N-acetylglucosamine 1-carboxyvinyltransferase